MASGPKRVPDPLPGPPVDWRRIHLWQLQPVRDLLVLAAVFGLVYLGYVLRVVTVPILLAIALAYLFEPLVAKLTTRKRWLSRPGVAVGIIALTVVVIVVPTIIGVGFATVQGTRVVERLATNVQWLVESVEKPDDAALREQLRGRTWKNLREWIVKQRLLDQPPPAPGQSAPAVSESPTAVSESPANGSQPPAQPSVPAVHERPSPLYEIVRSALTWLKDNKERIGQIALRSGGQAASLVARLFGYAAAVLFGTFLTAFFFYFFCTGYGRVLVFWKGLIPERRKHRAFELLDKMDRVIAGFIRGRITICAVLMGYYSLGYWLIGVPAPLVLGPLVGIMSIVPYLAGLGIPISMLLMALDPGVGWQAQWWWIVGSPLLVHGLAQVLDDYVMTPAIQGKSTDMDTPSILFASLAGGVLGGIYGLLLAIPVAACLKILLREVFWPRFRQWAEGRAKDFLPIEPG